MDDPQKFDLWKFWVAEVFIMLRGYKIPLIRWQRDVTAVKRGG